MSVEITDDQIAGFPPEAQAIIRALLAQNAQLKKRVGDLEAKLNKTSKNSSKPPSAVHPHAKPEPPAKKKSKRKRGGQPGHERFQRELCTFDTSRQLGSRVGPYRHCMVAWTTIESKCVLKIASKKLAGCDSGLYFAQHGSQAHRESTERIEISRISGCEN